MTHIDEDELTLIAIGDVRPNSFEAAHLVECAACTALLAELTGLVSLGRSSGGEQQLAPPPELWSRIQSELRLGSPATVSFALVVSPLVSPDASLESAPVDTPDVFPVGAADAPHRARGRWRTRAVVPIAVAALVVGVVAGAGVGVWWQSAQTANSPAVNAGVVVAGAELDPFPGWPDARGSAVIEKLPDGRRQVVIDVDAVTESAPSDAKLREVWLIRNDGTGLVSIGYLDGVEGRFDVPAGIDLALYSLVDVSAEKDNGDATHSGDSIVRGELRSI